MYLHLVLNFIFLLTPIVGVQANPLELIHKANVLIFQEEFEPAIEIYESILRKVASNSSPEDFIGEVSITTTLATLYIRVERFSQAIAIQNQIYEKLNRTPIRLPPKIINLKVLVPDLFMAYSKPKYAVLSYKNLLKYMHIMIFKKKISSDNITALLPPENILGSEFNMIFTMYRNVLGGLAKALIESKNYDESKLLISHLDSSDALNQYTLAKLYIRSKNKRKLKRGYQLLKESAKNGLLSSQITLGKIHLRGSHGKEKNHLTAYLWLKSALASLEDPSLRYLAIGDTGNHPKLQDKLGNIIKKIERKISITSKRKAQIKIAKFKSQLRQKSKKRDQALKNNITKLTKATAKKQDYLNQKAISNALKSYQADTGKTYIIRSQEDIEFLIKKRYLKSFKDVPGCENEPPIYFSDSVGNVWSLKYGSIDGKVISGGFLNPSLAQGTGKCKDPKIVKQITAALTDQ